MPGGTQRDGGGTQRDGSVHHGSYSNTGQYFGFMTMYEVHNEDSMKTLTLYRPVNRLLNSSDASMAAVAMRSIYNSIPLQCAIQDEGVLDYIEKQCARS
jgi:hypothetical protein